MLGLGNNNLNILDSCCFLIFFFIFNEVLVTIGLRSHTWPNGNSKHFLFPTVYLWLASTIIFTRDSVLERIKTSGLILIREQLWSSAMWTNEIKSYDEKLPLSRPTLYKHKLNFRNNDQKVKSQTCRYICTNKLARAIRNGHQSKKIHHFTCLPTRLKSVLVLISNAHPALPHSMFEGNDLVDSLEKSEPILGLCISNTCPLKEWKDPTPFYLIVKK